MAALEERAVWGLALAEKAGVTALEAVLAGRVDVMGLAEKVDVMDFEAAPARRAGAMVLVWAAALEA